MSEKPKEFTILPPADPPVCEPVRESSPIPAPAAPSAMSGAADGRPAPAPAPPGAPSAPEAAPEAAQAAQAAAFIGEPGTLPPTWCRKCEATVKPEGKGRCPRCQSFLRLNFASRKHVVNRMRRQQLLDQFVIDYRPTTQRVYSQCEQLAAIIEQLEVLKPGSPDHQRLVTLSQTLGAALEEEHPAPAVAPDDYAALTDDELVERLEALLKHARECRDSRAQPSAVADVVSEPGSAGHVDATPAARRPTAPPPTPATCAYGCGSRCAEVRATNYDAWLVLHSLDPEVIRARDEAATREMRAMVGEGISWHRDQ